MSIYKKLTQVQNELKAPKNQYNNFGKYPYRNAEDILEAVKPILLKYGLTQIINDEIVLIGERYYAKSVVTVFDEEGNSLQVSASAREPQSRKGMDEAQVTGASSSYARKYALNGMYAIDDTKDVDTNEHRNDVNNRPINAPNNQVKNTRNQLQQDNKPKLSKAMQKLQKLVKTQNISTDDLLHYTTLIKGDDNLSEATDEQVNEIIEIIEGLEQLAMEVN